MDSVIFKTGCKTWTDTPPNIQMSHSIWIDALHHMLLGNCKLKQQDATIHLLKWPKSKTLTTPNAGK